MTVRSSQPLPKLVVALAMLVLGSIGLLGTAAGAQGADVSAAELQELIGEAVDDPAAREELRGVRSVDGRPVDLRLLLDDVSGAEQAARLEALGRELDASGSGPSAGVSEDDPAALAREVLDDPKFEDQQLPRPFKGILERLADLLRPVGRALEPITDLFSDVPGGGFVIAGLAGLLLGAAAWVLVLRGGRAAVQASEEAWRLVDPAADPDDLERRADAARADGDHTAEVRLRYEAGLLRLAAQGRIELRPQTTAAGVAAQLDEPAIGALTGTFETVVYGGREADEADAEEARVRWPELLAVGSRR